MRTQRRRPQRNKPITTAAHRRARHDFSIAIGFVREEGLELRIKMNGLNLRAIVGTKLLIALLPLLGGVGWTVIRALGMG